MKKELRKIFETLMFGEPADFKIAKKEIEKIWRQDKKGEFKKYAPIALEYIKRFDEVKASKNQAAFASGLALFYLALSDKHFETLKNFTLKLIQSQDGHVRDAIRKTSDWLYVSLTARMDPFTLNDKLTSKQIEAREKARKQHLDYVKEIEDLIEKYASDEDNSVEYINDLKPSVYKSLQMLWDDLNRGQHIYLDDNPSEELLAKRREIRTEVSEMLEKIGSEYDFEDIVDIVYNENSNDAFREILRMFDRGQDPVELQNILDMISDVWNHFPHKTLGGKSPYQMVEDYKSGLKP